MKKVFIKNYGCSANYNHGQIMAGLLSEKGYAIVSSPDDADIIVINSCIVKSVTENRIKAMIKILSVKFPSKRIIVAGCGADKKEIFEKTGKGLVFLSSHRVEDIVSAVEDLRDKTGIRKEEKLLRPKIRENNIVNITEIAQGCLGNCSFCITKHARGDLISYDEEKIIEEIRVALNDGCKEIWLTSQDCGCYGIDRGTDICNLLERICAISGKFRVRLGMSNPQFIKLFPERLALLFRHEKMFKFLHIPVQSGSDKILHLMKRGHTADDFRKIIDTFRKTVPDVTISTDIIVGFPGETKEDFEMSKLLIEEIKPDIVNISRFGARKGTEAAKMKQIPAEISKERAKMLASSVKKAAKERNAAWIGRECIIIVDEKGKKKNQWVGRNESYKPVVIETERDVMGLFLKVRITGAGQTHLKGEIIEE